MGSLDCNTMTNPKPLLSLEKSSTSIAYSSPFPFPSKSESTTTSISPEDIPKLDTMELQVGGMVGSILFQENDDDYDDLVAYQNEEDI